MITIKTEHHVSPMTGPGYKATADNGDAAHASTWRQAAVIVANRNAKPGDTIIVHGPNGQNVVMDAR